MSFISFVRMPLLCISAGAMSILLVASVTAAPVDSSTQLDGATAKSIVTLFYQALTASTPSTLEPLLMQVTSNGWLNCSANEICQTRTETIERWRNRIAIVPDMRWVEQEMIVAGSQIVVRGEVSGTPVATFLGIQPQGRSFRVMTIDIHDVRDGKIMHTRHFEDWMSAFNQLSQMAVGKQEKP